MEKLIFLSMTNPKTRVLALVTGPETTERCINFRYVPNSIQLHLLSVTGTNFSFFSILRFIPLALKAWLTCSSEKWDVVISLSTWTGMIFSLLQKVPIKKSLPHIVVESSSLPLLATSKGFVPKLATMLAKFSFSGVTRIICFTTGQRDFWNRYLGFRDKAIFVPLGEPVSRILMSKSSGDYIFSGGKTGRDFLTPIYAAEKLNLRLVIVGPCNENIKQVAKSNVKIVESIPFPEYLSLLRNSSFVVLALKHLSYSVGLSTLLTSMASGKVVIATKTSGFSDYIIDYETGIFVNPFDINDLEEKMRYLLRNPSEVKRIGNNAIQTVKNHFSEPIMERKITNILLDAVKLNSRGCS